MASIAYADLLDIQPLPIDAQSIVTDPRLVIAGNRAGPEPDYENVLNTVYDPSPTQYHYMRPVPLPITHQNPSALHATYLASRAYTYTPGVNPWIEPADLDASVEPGTVNGITNAGSPSAIRDGDDLTYAESDLSAGATITWTSAPGYRPMSDMFFGARLRYDMSINGTPKLLIGTGGGVGILKLRMQSFHSDDGGILKFEYRTERRWRLQVTDGPTEIYVITPFDARGHADTADRIATRWYGAPLNNEYSAFAQINVAGQDAASNLKVYAFYPLYVDQVQADAICKRNYKLPAVTPKRITLAGYVAPAASHTITGWPGGDYTGLVARQTYGGGRTIIDFEQAGAPTADAQAVMEAERARQHVEGRRRSRDTYNLVMGERQ